MDSMPTPSHFNDLLHRCTVPPFHPDSILWNIGRFIRWWKTGHWHLPNNNNPLPLPTRRRVDSATYIPPPPQSWLDQTRLAIDTYRSGRRRAIRAWEEDMRRLPRRLRVHFVEWLGNQTETYGLENPPPEVLSAGWGGAARYRDVIREAQRRRREEYVARERRRLREEEWAAFERTARELGIWRDAPTLELVLRAGEEARERRGYGRANMLRAAQDSREMRRYGRPVTEYSNVLDPALRALVLELRGAGQGALR